jgi:enoyl-CoA hydratase/carnithine racemase
MTDVTTGAPPSLEIEGDRALIRFNRPRQHNRIEPLDLLELTRLLDRVEGEPALRVLVFTGTGKSFSSGFHIAELGQAKGQAIPEFSEVMDRIERVRLPTICALNGGVYGGSTDLALACDFRIGVTGMQFRMPATALGVHYYPGGLRRYVSRLGLPTAKRMFLLAETIGAEELLRLGYLDELVEPERLMPRVAELAARMAGHAPLILQGTKKALDDIARGEGDDAEIAARAKRLGESEDAKEGRLAWLEKRPPRYQGR